MARTGHCLCGAITYGFEGEPAAVVLCHCDDCQRHSGAAFSFNVVVPRAALLVEGSPRVHKTTGTESGHPRERLFCGECGSPLFTMMAEQPEIAIIKAGTLDDRSGLVPTAEVWCRREHEWMDTSPDRARFEGDLQPA
jgi:hypothetical protein